MGEETCLTDSGNGGGGGAYSGSKWVCMWAAVRAW